MPPETYRFGPFTLRRRDRLLLDGERAIELNSRYLDALTLLVSEPGTLITKTRFLDEVWQGVPVTDEALTQCIRTLRRQLGDDATAPRFIETVPKHGYRFIAPVAAGDVQGEPPALSGASVTEPAAWQAMLETGRLGLVGGGAAGLVGGLIYGAMGIVDGVGGVSALFVFGLLTMLVGMLGGASVGAGLGLSALFPQQRLLTCVLGGAAGGMLIGALFRTIGLDALNVLFGPSPAAITGAPEGALLGAAIGLGGWLALWTSQKRRLAVLVSGAIAALAGIAIGLTEGNLLGGSLDALSGSFADSRLQVGRLGALFGESTFGPRTRMITGALEAALFGMGMALALTSARRR